MPGATTTKRPLPSPTAPSRAAAGALCLATTARAARTPLVALFEDFFVARKPIKGSPHTEAAYRRDLLGVLAHLTTELGTETTKLRLGQLTAKALRRAFASLSEGHAASSIARAWTAWDQFFAFLVAEDVVIGNPMAAVAKPKVPRREPKALQGEGTPERLLTSLSTGEHQGRGSWPERDLAFVATALLTGLRLSELLGLDSGSLDGRKGERRARVLGKGSKVRFVPLEAPLEALLATYLGSRKARFPAEKVDRLSPLFSTATANASTAVAPNTSSRRRTAPPTSGAGAQGRPRARLAPYHGHPPGRRRRQRQRDPAPLGHESLATSQLYIDSTANKQRAAASEPDLQSARADQWDSRGSPGIRGINPGV